MAIGKGENRNSSAIVICGTRQSALTKELITVRSVNVSVVCAHKFGLNVSLLSEYEQDIPGGCPEGFSSQIFSLKSHFFQSHFTVLDRDHRGPFS
jgi:hypothetical protein